MAIIRKTREQLEYELIELRGQMPGRYISAAMDIKKASVHQLKGSGVLVTLTFLGGRSVTAPFVIHDGLSDETIKALGSDIERSRKLAGG